MATPRPKPREFRESDRFVRRFEWLKTSMDSYGAEHRALWDMLKSYKEGRVSARPRPGAASRGDIEEFLTYYEKHHAEIQGDLLDHVSAGDADRLAAEHEKTMKLAAQALKSFSRWPKVEEKWNNLSKHKQSVIRELKAAASKPPSHAEIRRMLMKYRREADSILRDIRDGHFSEDDYSVHTETAKGISLALHKLVTSKSLSPKQRLMLKVLSEHLMQRHFSDRDKFGRLRDKISDEEARMKYTTRAQTRTDAIDALQLILSQHRRR
jgi:hypothetical protein